MSIDRCLCHGKPAAWCPGAAGFTSEQLLSGDTLGKYGPMPEIGPDDRPHRGTASPGGGYECDADCPGWHDGVIVPAPGSGVCAVCGGQYGPADLVAKMPLPCWGAPYAHEVCPSP
jgi:hypothetical protein